MTLNYKNCKNLIENKTRLSHNSPAANDEYFITNNARYDCLTNKNIIITGGASGIGKSLVHNFCAQGANVFFVDNAKQAGEQLVEDINHYNPRANVQFISCDVRDSEKLQRVLSELCEQLTTVDVLVNNVADDMRHNWLTMNSKQWSECMSVNLDSAFFCSQTVLPFMQAQQSGSVINFGSITSKIGEYNMAGYITAKSALLGMTTAFAKEVGKDKIRVNAILPGWVATEKQLNLWMTDEQSWRNTLLIDKRLVPQDIADLALFLASSGSTMITGQALTVDGGKTMGA